jgi:hypothetical protein
VLYLVEKGKRTLPFLSCPGKLFCLASFGLRLPTTDEGREIPMCPITTIVLLLRHYLLKYLRKQDIFVQTALLIVSFRRNTSKLTNYNPCYVVPFSHRNSSPTTIAHHFFATSLTFVSNCGAVSRFAHYCCRRGIHVRCPCLSMKPPV